MSNRRRDPYTGLTEEEWDESVRFWRERMLAGLGTAIIWGLVIAAAVMACLTAAAVFWVWLLSRFLA